MKNCSDSLCLLNVDFMISFRAVSTRVAASIWWFFTLIMVSSYTANLAAFLTVQNKFYAIKSVQDLANNPYGITYGAKKGGATYSFFKVRVWLTMKVQYT